MIGTAGGDTLRWPMTRSSGSSFAWPTRPLITVAVGEAQDAEAAVAVDAAAPCVSACVGTALLCVVGLLAVRGMPGAADCRSEAAGTRIAQSVHDSRMLRFGPGTRAPEEG